MLPCTLDSSRGKRSLVEADLNGEPGSLQAAGLLDVALSVTMPGDLLSSRSLCSKIAPSIKVDWSGAEEGFEHRVFFLSDPSVMQDCQLRKRRLPGSNGVKTALQRCVANRKRGCGDEA